MSADLDLNALAEQGGILRNYYDMAGQERITSRETQLALLKANGFDVSSDAAIRDALALAHAETQDRWFPQEFIITSDRDAHLPFGLGAQWQLIDETGAIRHEGLAEEAISLPPCAAGVYDLVCRVGGREEVVIILAAPDRLPSVEQATGQGRLWGLNAALYALRSARNSGLGDFEDLAQLAEIAAAQGASFVGINPVHAIGYADMGTISPYSPSHRGFLNSSHIALDRICGASTAEMTGLDWPKHIGYVAHKTAHHQILERLYSYQTQTMTPDDKLSLQAFIEAGGERLRDFTRFEALSEIYGLDWRSWPDDPKDDLTDRMAYHAWLQWVADVQLGEAQGRARTAGMGLGLYLDLAVGPRRDGAESWCEADAIAQGVSIGAPPDHLSPEGQNWGLAAFSPRKLRAARYAPLRAIIAKTMRHAGVMRIDHVLGLNRSFWIPDDGSPGAYIHQPFEALLAIIKIEATRHGTVVIGEDLGLVPDGFRDTMRANGFYGYSVTQYERGDDGNLRDSSQGPQQVLSCFATHDTPTIKGFENGRDIDWWQELGWIDEDNADRVRQERARDVEHLSGANDFAHDVHAALAHSPAAMVTVQLDDVFGDLEAQNLPGTVDAHPNWRRRYDTPLEVFAKSDQLETLSHVMKDADRATPTDGDD